jgi:hypothetical protein
MKKTLNIYLVSIFILVILSVSGCVGLINNDVIGQIELHDLLVPIDVFPSGWSFGGSGFGIDPDRSFDSSGITYYSDKYPTTTGCSEDIYRHKSISVAKRDYQYSVSAFGNGEAPSEWEFQSMYADETHFACDIYPGTSFPECSWVGRYNRIVIDFGCWLVPERMELIAMEKIVISIDKSVGELIK